MKLHSKIIGSGKPLVILHGFLGTGDNWKTLGNKFANPPLPSAYLPNGESGFEVHLVDQRNHGRSPHSKEFDYDILAGDIKDYCTAHQLENISLVGHSMGGKTAMFTACDYPSLIEKLIVVDISPKYYPPHHQAILEGLSFLDSQTLNSREKADELLSKYVEETGTRQFLLKNLYWIVPKKLGLRMNLKSLANNIENMGAKLPEGKTFSKDVLFVKGENSDYVQNKDIEQIKKHFPKAEIETVKNAGHWVHAENREGFFEAVMRFLGK